MEGPPPLESESWVEKTGARPPALTGREAGEAPPKLPTPRRPRVERVRRERQRLVIPPAVVYGAVGIASVLALAFAVAGLFRLEPDDHSSVGRSMTALAGLPSVTPTLLLPPDYILQLSATAPVFTPTSPPITATPDIPENFFDVPTLPPPTASPTVGRGDSSPTPAFVSQPSPTPTFDLLSSLIVYVCYINRSDEICTIRADGAGRSQLTSTPGTDWYPSLSPDGRWITFSSQRDGQFEIYVMGADGSDPIRLTRGHGSNYAPSFSPDMQWIVFTSTYQGVNGAQNIWLMKADGSEMRQLTDTPYNSIDPEWSPDGSLISFASNRDGPTDLYVMNPDGSGVRRITQGAQLGGRNDWSPNGRFMAFYAGPGNDKDIFILSADCAYLASGCIANPIRLTDGGNNKGPSFSPDGQWIVYTSELNGINNIYRMRLDGSEVTQLTFDIFANWQPRWRRR